MTIEVLRVLYDYNYWANRHLFRVLAQAPPDDFIRPAAGSYGSIRNTLVHVMSAEWGWLERCGGPARGPKLRAEDFPDLQSVVSTWQAVERYASRFLETLNDADLNREVQFAIGSDPPQSMRIGELLHHAVVHATHHRGQIALLLRTLGHAPGNFDILFYYAEKRGVAGH